MSLVVIEPIITMLLRIAMIFLLVSNLRSEQICQNSFHTMNHCTENLEENFNREILKSKTKFVTRDLYLRGGDMPDEYDFLMQIPESGESEEGVEFTKKGNRSDVKVAKYLCDLAFQKDIVMSWKSI